jgi:uncharacterized membrane protein (TIGR02234 family)
MTSDMPVTGRRQRRLPALPPRRELTAILLLGAAGAGLVLLAMRQDWAQVRTAVPAPLPTSVVTDSGQSLVPYADALAIAALASLAAVLATRRVGRRMVGVLLVCLGAGTAAAVTGGVSTAAALAAAAGSLGPAAGSGAGNSAGSVTEGSTTGGSSAVPDVAGFHHHVVVTAAGWQAMAIVGALAIIAAGVLVTWRALRLPVMSSRYDAPAGSAAARPSPAHPGDARPAGAHANAAGPADPGPGGADPAGAGPGGPSRDGTTSDGAGPGGTGRDAAQQRRAEQEAADQRRADSATMWESLSRGEDPTSVGQAG